MLGKFDFHTNMWCFVTYESRRVYVIFRLKNEWIFESRKFKKRQNRQQKGLNRKQKRKTRPQIVR